MAKRKQLHCVEVSLHPDLLVEAAYRAIEVNPVNAARGVMEPSRIAVLTQKYWGARATDITVGFMEQTSQAMATKVLAYANRWSEFAKVKFRATQTDPMVRISFGRGGYWSYLGTDILSIPRDQQTMNLEAFTLRTPDSEWARVVCHEFGHTLGCPHEQQRQAILDLLDPQKVIAYFGRTQGWSADEVRQQILVPLEERSLMGASPADQASIMCYQFPGSVTKSGQPIPGGNDFSPTDKLFFAKVYPPDVVQPPPPPTGQVATTMRIYDQTGALEAEYAIQRTK